MRARFRRGAPTLHRSTVLGDRLLHAELANPHAGSLANVSAELAKLRAKIEAVEKEISDTMVELRTAEENGDTGEVGRLIKREEALRDKEKQMRDKVNCSLKPLLEEERKVLLRERALLAPGVLPAPSRRHPSVGPTSLLLFTQVSEPSRVAAPPAAPLSR